MVEDENLHAADSEGRPADDHGADAGSGAAHAEGAEEEGRPSREHPLRKHAKKGSKEALEHAERRAADLGERNAALEAEVKDLRDKWLRTAADLENFRKRTRKEWDLLQLRTKADVILEVLAVVDDFERAFSMAADRDDEFIRGIRLIYNKLLSSLERLGVRKIEALDAVFDPAYHMAVAQIERDGANSNHVVEVVQEGYCLGDFLVRPAKVVIAK